jgi:ribosomal protein S18 acetylase RimI-like enzyme
LSLRNATFADIDALSTLEARCFDGDRLSRRSFRHMVASPSAACRIAGEGGRIEGYAITLFRRNGGYARLYSLAVDPRAREAGLGKALLEDAEMIAQRRGARGLRLEVRQDNLPALGLYRRRGYEIIATIPTYYEDGTDAFRMQKMFGGRAGGADHSTEI